MSSTDNPIAPNSDRFTPRANRAQVRAQARVREQAEDECRAALALYRSTGSEDDYRLLCGARARAARCW